VKNIRKNFFAPSSIIFASYGYDQLQCLSFLVSTAGTTGMNMSVENNMLHLLRQTILSKVQFMIFPKFAF